MNPRGWCIFCQRQNAPDAERCETCGRLLPKVAGVNQGLSNAENMAHLRRSAAALDAGHGISRSLVEDDE